MTQVVTVSANTAAYAAEALRPSARVSGQAHSEKTPKARAAEEKRSGAIDAQAPAIAVSAPAVTLFFLTAEKQPNLTYERAHEEYLAALAEYRSEHEAGGEDAEEAP
jgi:hypothetical protein